MNATSKFLIGGLLVAGTATYLMASAIRETGVFYLTPGELAARVAADSAFYNVGVRVGAHVVPGSIQRDPGGREVSFRAEFEKDTLAVTYRGIAPETFTDSADVVVEGKLDRSTGTFRATVLLAKCASRLEAMPERYRTTTGPATAQQSQR